VKAAEAMQWIAKARILPAVRTATADHARRAITALRAGGITVLEVPVTVPCACEIIRDTRLEFGDKVLIGAGTITNDEELMRALANGAQFIVSPILNVSVIHRCLQQDIAVFPGALTPSEVLNAWQAGASCVKVFPVSAVGGVEYIRALRVPLPNVKMMPMGGVSIENAAEFMLAGAIAVGVGSGLVDNGALRQGRDYELTEKARQYIMRLSSAPSGMLPKSL
jgi:2-dehydro-3-deoxyphosphogluconate aldolase / (4S)-4-hydroxy-2-oxoglutarate aldolase